MAQLAQPPSAVQGLRLVPAPPDSTSPSAACAERKFAERETDLRLEGTLTIDADSISGHPAPVAIVSRRKQEFCDAALKYVSEFFQAQTGSERYFANYLRQELGWIVTELISNELYHGILGFDSRDKFSLTTDDATILDLFGPGTDVGEKRAELENRLADAVRALRGDQRAELRIETGTDEEGFSFIEIRVGAPREFDLAAAVKRSDDEMASVDNLLAEGKEEEAMVILKRVWGRGLLTLKGKLSGSGDSLTQESPPFGAIVVRKRLPAE